MMNVTISRTTDLGNSWKWIDATQAAYETDSTQSSPSI